LPVILIALISLTCAKEGSNNLETIKITFWHSFVASTRNALNELINDFKQEYPKININAQYVPTGDALVQKLITAIQSNTAPDISWIHADFIDKLAGAKAIYHMRKFIDGPEGFSEEELNDIFYPLIESATWRDTLFALPMEATSLALFYNKDLFKKAGLNPDLPPKTWTELKEYTKKLTVDKDSDGKIDQYGFYVPVFPTSGPLNLWMILQWTPFLWQAGGQLLTTDKITVQFNSDPGVQALELWKILYDIQTFGNFSMSHDLGFSSQSVAMILDGPWNLPRYRKIKNFTWAVAPLPKGPVRQATYLSGEYLVIFKQSAHPHQAWKFLKWMLRPETQAKFSINSGYLPVKRSTLELKSYREHLQNDEAIRTFINQIDISESRRLPNYYRVEFNRFVARALEESILGNENPRKVLNKMAELANDLLKKKN